MLMSTFSEKPACKIITISAFLVILGHFIVQTNAYLFIHFKQGIGTQADAYVNSQQSRRKHPHGYKLSTK